MRTIAGRLLSALLCAALVLSPVTAFGATSAPTTHDSAMSKSMPCDMPCKGCSDRVPSLSCVAACMGLVAALPSFERARAPRAIAQRVALAVHRTLVGVEREPDTPPPKFVLA
jgi:hypothetical protein